MGDLKDLGTLWAYDRYFVESSAIWVTLADCGWEGEQVHWVQQCALNWSCLGSNPTLLPSSSSCSDKLVIYSDCIAKTQPFATLLIEVCWLEVVTPCLSGPCPQ